ncbi:element excision factor XisH family protein [Geminocystis sp. CENA526]|uniref:element excision factor XisH family protein n=1 Tax=Geminocystis sp. CENA526 TaxID=1355871 RepID=UPI003D700215
MSLIVGWALPTLPEYQVYLAIKDSVYENFFKRESIQDIAQINQLLLIVIEMEREEILQWID